MVVLSQGDSFVLFSNSGNDCERYYLPKPVCFFAIKLSAILCEREGTKKLPYKTKKIFVTFCLQKVK